MFLHQKHRNLYSIHNQRVSFKRICIFCSPFKYITFEIACAIISSGSLCDKMFLFQFCLFFTIFSIWIELMWLRILQNNNKCVWKKILVFLNIDKFTRTQKNTRITENSKENVSISKRIDKIKKNLKTKYYISWYMHLFIVCCEFVGI